MSRRDISRPNNNQAVRQSVSVSQATFYSGQLPPAEMMEQYAQIDPEIPKTIIGMAKSEAGHRHYCEKMVTRAHSFAAVAGMLFAFASVLIVSYLVYLALNKGFENAASIIATGAIAAVAGVFILRRNRSAKEK